MEGPAVFGARAGPMSGFLIVPEEEAFRSGKSAAPRESHWLEEDVKRAIAAAEEAGLRSYRVEIGPDGTISLVVGGPEDATAPHASAADQLAP